MSKMNASWSLENRAQTIHVLYVDHDNTYDTLRKDMFAYFSFKVTVAKFASIALEMLTDTNPQFDLVMENINSPYSYGRRLLEDATKEDMPVVMMTEDDELVTTMVAIGHGAIYCISNPITFAQIANLRQHVLEEKICGTKVDDGLKGPLAQNEWQNNGIGHKLNNKKSSKSARKKRNLKKSNEKSMKGDNVIGVRKKSCIEWTPELHAKFTDAVKQLGEERCFPQAILKLMNVSGLERMQVASHLQKCRNENCQFNREREHDPNLHPKTTSLRSKKARGKPMRYGTMPRPGCRPETISQQELNLQQTRNKNTVKIPKVDSSLQNGVREKCSNNDLTSNNGHAQGYTQFGQHRELDEIEQLELFLYGRLMSDTLPTYDGHIGTITSANNQTD